MLPKSDLVCDKPEYVMVNKRWILGAALGVTQNLNNPCHDYGHKSSLHVLKTAPTRAGA